MAARPPPEFAYKDRAFLAKGTPSRRDMMHLPKEDSLLWEASSLISYAAKRIRMSHKATTCAMVILRRAYLVRSLKHNDHSVMAVGALFLSTKLNNAPVQPSDCAAVIMHAASHWLKQQVFSTELKAAYAIINAPNEDRTAPAFTHKWESLKKHITNQARMAEAACLLNVGFHELHHIGWEWDVLATISKRYQLHKCPGWDPHAQATSAGTAMPVALAPEPQATAASAVGRGAAAATPLVVHKCGKDLATDFLMDAAAMSNVHSQFTPTTVALAAMKWAFDVANISWQAVLKDKGEERKMPVWEHYRQSAIDATSHREVVSLDAMAAATAVVQEGMKAHSAYYKRQPTASAPLSHASTWHARPHATTDSGGGGSCGTAVSPMAVSEPQPTRKAESPRAASALALGESGLSTQVSQMRANFGLKLARGGSVPWSPRGEARHVDRAAGVLQSGAQAHGESSRGDAAAAPVRSKRPREGGVGTEATAPAPKAGKSSKEVQEEKEEGEISDD